MRQQSNLPDTIMRAERQLLFLNQRLHRSGGPRMDFGLGVKGYFLLEPEMEDLVNDLRVITNELYDLLDALDDTVRHRRIREEMYA